jgi:hypothetical protein
MACENECPLAAEILSSLKSNALGKESPDSFKSVGATTTLKPRFGSVYFGPLPCFAFGKPNFAMAQSRMEEDL